MFQRKPFRTLLTVSIALGGLLGSSSQAEAGLLGPSSSYLVQISPAARTAVEGAIKNAGGRIDGRFQYAYDGFLINLPDMLIPLLKKIPNVLTVEKDQPLSGLAIQNVESPTPSWGIDRIDQREKVIINTPGSYGYRSAGRGATIYIGDTGIYPHQDLAGRISTVGFSGISDGNGTVDCNGHGTHVATTAAGTQYGVAKNATVVPVRVLNCSGMGSFSTVIAGLDWILSPLNTNPKSAAVLNLSIGGNASSAVNDAILRLTNAGITVVAAAGNESTDACTRSPASAPSAITVGATTALDTLASFSNFGSCVDISAPGSGITGGWIGSANASVTISGTSMATPHVTGAAAVYLGLHPTASVAQVTEALKADATKDAITNLPANTVNNLLYVSPTDGGAAIVEPKVIINTVTGITHQQAQANVEINPNNAPTTATLEYGTDATFTTVVKRINLTPTPLDGADSIAVPTIMDGLQPSTTYYFRAIGSNESGSFTTPTGTFKSIAPPVTAPVAIAKAASSITGWSAQLNGTMTAGNGTTTVAFQYGTDPEFITNTNTGLASSPSLTGNTAVPVNLGITFLDPTTTYYFRLTGSNSAASVVSAVESFTTPALVGVAPLVETIRPTNGINVGTTTVTGRVNPNGQTTSVRFVWGSEPSLTVGQRVVDLATKYTGVETVTVTADMVGATAGVRYYYRFEASNAAGFTKPVPLTNIPNPIMPTITNTYGNGQTQTGVTLNSVVNAGGSNIRIYFIYGTDPKLETGTAIGNGNPFALTNGYSYTVSLPLTGLKPNTTIYFRTKIFAYTGPLVDSGSVMMGPIARIQTLMPTRTPQTVTFNLATSRYYGGAPTSLTATASSGLPVTYTTTTPRVCAISTTDSGTVLVPVTPIPAGVSSICNVVASQIGNDTIASANPQSRNITFVKENTGIRPTWNSPITVAGGGLDLALISTSQPTLGELIASETAVALTSLTPKVCVVENPTYVGGTTVHTRATVKGLYNGTCQLQAAFAGYGYWLPASSVITVSVSGITAPQPGAYAPQTISFSQPPNAVLGSPVTLVASATSTLPVTLTSLTPAVCTVSVNANNQTIATPASGLTGDANTCQIQATQAGDSRWAAAPAVTRVFGFQRPAQAITFILPTMKYYGGPKLILNATSTSGLPVSFSTTTPAICSIGRVETQSVLNYSDSLPVVNPALCTVIASQAGDGNFKPAQNIVRTVGLYKENTGIRISWSGPITAAGAYLNLIVVSAAQQALNEQLAGTTPLTVISKTPSVCKVDGVDYQGTSTAHTRAFVKSLWNGSCQLTISFAGNSYWLPTSATLSTLVSGMVTPLPGANAAQSISLATPLTAEIGANTTFTAVATSKLPVTVTTTTPAVCSVAPTATAFVVTSAAGLSGNGNICTVQATQAGTDAWAPATTVTRNITINKANTTVRLVRTYSSLIGKTPYTFVAGTAYLNTLLNNGASSLGNWLAVTTTTPAVCSVTNVGELPTTSGAHTQATINGLTNGTCLITYTYPGSASLNGTTRTISALVSGIK